MVLNKEDVKTIRWMFKHNEFRNQVDISFNLITYLILIPVMTTWVLLIVLAFGVSNNPTVAFLVAFKNIYILIGGMLIWFICLILVSLSLKKNCIKLNTEGKKIEYLKPFILKKERERRNRRW